jgi:multidrug efflux pump subunit AcrA (membrane-fusion protein)
MPPELQNRYTQNSILRSEVVNAIIFRKPGLWDKWALFVFFFIMVFVLGGTWFIKYPDIVQAHATLTALDAPKEIMVREDGKLIRLFVGNDDIVIKNQTIAWIESTASHQEVINLASMLTVGIQYITNDNSEKVSFLFKKNFQNLGELQSQYQQFIIAWQQFNDYLVNGYYYKHKKILLTDKEFLKKMHKALEQQKNLIHQDLQLAEETFDSNNSLFKDKVISKQELRDQKGKLISKQMNLPQLESSILSNESLQITKQKEIDELEHNISQQKIIFQQALQTLKSATNDWEKKYVIKAATNGKAIFLFPLQENQFLLSGKTIGFVNPTNSRYFAQITLPQNNFGKVEKGQKVQLRFDAYPYQEFGIVEGKLKYISKLPSDSGFLAYIELPKGLTTNYRQQIQYQNGLKSEALIITREARLSQRIYYSLIKLVHQ